MFIFWWGFIGLLFIVRLIVTLWHSAMIWGSSCMRNMFQTSDSAFALTSTWSVPDIHPFFYLNEHRKDKRYSVFLFIQKSEGLRVPSIHQNNQKYESMPFIVGELWTIFERHCKSRGNSSMASLEQGTFVLYLLMWQNEKRTAGFKRWAEFKSKVVCVFQNLRTDLKYWTDLHLNFHFTNCDFDYSFRNNASFIPVTQFKVL